VTTTPPEMSSASVSHLTDRGTADEENRAGLRRGFHVRLFETLDGCLPAILGRRLPGPERHGGHSEEKQEQGLRNSGCPHEIRPETFRVIAPANGSVLPGGTRGPSPTGTGTMPAFQCLPCRTPTFPFLDKTQDE